MKKLFILYYLILLSIARILAQDNSGYSAEFHKLEQLYAADKIHEAYMLLDKMIKEYPDYGYLYYLRGSLKLYLCDFNSARSDMIMAEQLGHKYKREYDKAIISKDYMVQLVTENYIDPGLLKKDNDYKLIYGRKDSLQGGLRSERTSYDIYYYDLTVRINPKKKFIEGTNNIYFKMLDNSDRIQIDLASRYYIDAIKIDGVPVRFNKEYNAIFVTPDHSFKKDSSYILSVSYKGKPRVAPDPPWNGGFVWGKERSKHHVGVACEHLGASSWWPCKDHISEKPDSMTINVQVPSKYKGISNGNLISEFPVDNKFINYRWFVSYPINSYNATVYVGDFVNFNERFTNENGSYNIDYYVLPHNLKRAKEYYSQTKKVVEVYEDLYGEYPYNNDGIAMVESPFSGMEHQSAIAIGQDYENYDRFFINSDEYDYLIVHELAHEWWGNTVTMNDMADVWISEGFATFSELLFIEKVYGPEAYIDAVSRNMNYILNIWPVVGIRGVNDNAFLGGDVYNKGAITLHNLRCLVNNDSLFFAWIKDFYDEYKFKTISTNDFMEFTSDYFQIELSDFFQKYLYQKEPPILTYKYTLENTELSFSFKWDDVGENFTLPFSFRVNDTLCYTVNSTTQWQTIELNNVNRFDISTQFNYEEKFIEKNSYTYFWTKWMH